MHRRHSYTKTKTNTMDQTLINECNLDLARRILDCPDHYQDLNLRLWAKQTLARLGTPPEQRRALETPAETPGASPKEKERAAGA